jgi:hypothetical protein
LDMNACLRLTLPGIANGLKGMRMLVFLRVAAVLFVSFAGMTSAEASRRTADQAPSGEWWLSAFPAATEKSRSSSRPERTSRASRSDGQSESKFERGSGGVGPRPSAWCGWYMRTQLGGGPEYNLAWNWTKYGSPGSPQVGAVVVWRHHVGMITGQASNGQWIVKSGNDSNRVRERARSIAGAVIRV